jgi:PAS domain S-box-containing protein
MEHLLLAVNRGERWSGRMPCGESVDMRYETIIETAPVFVLAMDEHLRVVHCSRAAAAVIGCRERRDLREIVDAPSAASFADIQRDLKPGGAPVHWLATFFDCNGLHRKIAGLVDRAAAPDGAPLLRFTAVYSEACGGWLEQLILSEEVLRGFVQTSSEAMWCIEFSEPVDIGLGKHEIVRQVFENDCHWLLCNEALTRLYQLPEGLDIARQPVSLYFPRIAENEAFILQIIESGFAVDNSPSTDYRHDGTLRYMENNVRCSIVDGYLLRIFGTLRDVTSVRQAHKRLKNEAEKMRDILSALPDAIMVIDRDRRLMAVNSSFETLFGWNGEDFLGRDVQSIIDLERPLPGKRRGYGFDGQRWQTMVKTESDRHLYCEAQIAPLGDEAPEHFVLSLRPIADGAANGSIES